MTDFTWIATEANALHSIFYELFFVIMATLLIIGITLEYFKIPLGGVPSFMILVARAFIAAVMLASFQEFMNLLGTFTDSMVERLGSLNDFELVLSRMGSELDRLTWSWTSVKQMVVVGISFVSFFILYLSVYFAEALHLYSWTLLYIFSPLLIVLYVLPQTASATKNLYKALFMVCSWKIVWSVLATLLWSAALMDLDKLGDGVSFVTIVIFNLMLAASLLFTPLVVNALLNSGIDSIAPKIGAAGLAGAAVAVTKGKMISATGGSLTKRSVAPIMQARQHQQFNRLQDNTHQSEQSFRQEKMQKDPMNMTGWKTDEKRLQKSNAQMIKAARPRTSK